MYSPVQTSAYSAVESAVAYAFLKKAAETAEGPAKLCEEILHIPLSKLEAIAYQHETPDDCKTVVGQHVSYGTGLRSDQILDALIFVYGQMLDIRAMNAAQDRAYYRRRKQAKDNGWNY